MYKPTEMTGRHCWHCGKPLERDLHESRKRFARRQTCGNPKCVTALQAYKAIMAPGTCTPIAEWPAEMAITKPFATNARVSLWNPTRLSGPMSLVGGCSSSSGWDVGD
jgi:hypothetical protein